jgi:hypothetical protein
MQGDVNFGFRTSEHEKPFMKCYNWFICLNCEQDARFSHVWHSKRLLVYNIINRKCILCECCMHHGKCTPCVLIQCSTTHKSQALMFLVGCRAPLSYKTNRYTIDIISQWKFHRHFVPSLCSSRRSERGPDVLSLRKLGFVRPWHKTKNALFTGKQNMATGDRVCGLHRMLKGSLLT